MIDAYTRSNPTYQAAVRTGAKPMPLTAGEVAVLKRAHGWRGTMERRNLRGPNWLVVLFVIALFVAVLWFLTR